MSQIIFPPNDRFSVKIFNLLTTKTWSEMTKSEQVSFTNIYATEISKLPYVKQFVNGGKFDRAFPILVHPSMNELDNVKEMLTGMWQTFWDEQRHFWDTTYGTMARDQEGVKKQTGFEFVIELIRCRDGIALSRNVKPEHNVFHNIAYLMNARQWAPRHWSTVTQPFEDFNELRDAVQKWNVNGERQGLIEKYGFPEAWKVSKITYMNGLFADTNSRNFNEPIGAWNTNNVTKMAYMFSDIGYEGQESIFDMPLNGWDVSKVTDMHAMFRGASRFNQDLNDWNVENVTDMSGMFDGTQEFNGNISGWKTRSVTNMSEMFFGAAAFAPKDLNDWNTQSVEDMDAMFKEAELFNGNISEWRVARLERANEMFKKANSFTGDLSGWTLKGSGFTEMFAEAGNFVKELYLPHFEDEEIAKDAKDDVYWNDFHKKRRSGTGCSNASNSVVAQAFARFSL